ncbi:hypothetical protein PROFUN_03978 [Planoprotostelium fungivorum]|uniref:Myb-like domain-containing protein n=1 Tax=Planoprotostelium fungivorum TaxID=1890364 RepID=A0A2P6NW17_9EUKA|nr:hypothetical protein PROFUN_03978 [Planoprotostelium fungivorum]
MNREEDNRQRLPPLAGLYAPNMNPMATDGFYYNPGVNPSIPIVPPSISLNGTAINDFYIVNDSSFAMDSVTPAVVITNSDAFNTTPYVSPHTIRGDSSPTREGRKRRSLSPSYNDRLSVDRSSRSVSPKRDIDSSPSSHAKRHWESWSLNEMNAFFNGLKTCGKDFEQITNGVGTKNYDQVRYFYYRTLNKVMKLLKPNKIDKKDLKDVFNALFCYWDLRKSLRGKEEEYSPDFAMQLTESVSQVCTSFTDGSETPNTTRGRQKGKGKQERDTTTSSQTTINVPMMMEGGQIGMNIPPITIPSFSPPVSIPTLNSPTINIVNDVNYNEPYSASCG